MHVDFKALEKQIRNSEILVRSLEKKNDVLENSLKQFIENIESKAPTQMKIKKIITKKVIEERLIHAFEKDVDVMYNCTLTLESLA